MATTSGRLRALGTPRDPGELLLVDVASHDPVYLPREELEGVLPGHVVDAEIAWADGDPRVESFDVVERTLLTFVDGATNLFEAALDTWAEARREGVAVNSRVTYDTGKNPVGALYTFAEQPGARDVFGELRDGTLPLEPLLERAAEAADPPHEVFVMRPATHEFVLVYVVLDRGSVLADTVRDTYDCPRPAGAVIDDGSPDDAPPDDAGDAT